MESKKTTGRQKIPLMKIENKDARYCTFSKRCSGLYIKASELVRECDVDLGIVLSSPTGKQYSFVHPTTNTVIGRFMNPTIELSIGEQVVVANIRNNINQMNGRLNEFDIREKIAKQKIRFLDQMNETREKGWWESINQLNADDITKFEAWLDSGEFMMNYQLKQRENGASSSSQYLLEDANN